MSGIQVYVTALSFVIAIYAIYKNRKNKAPLKELVPLIGLWAIIIVLYIIP